MINKNAYKKNRIILVWMFAMLVLTFGLISVISTENTPTPVSDFNEDKWLMISSGQFDVVRLEQGGMVDGEFVASSYQDYDTDLEASAESLKEDIYDLENIPGEDFRVITNYGDPLLQSSSLIRIERGPIKEIDGSWSECRCNADYLVSWTCDSGPGTTIYSQYRSGSTSSLTGIGCKADSDCIDNKKCKDVCYDRAVLKEAGIGYSCPEGTTKTGGGVHTFTYSNVCENHQ